MRHLHRGSLARNLGPLVGRHEEGLGLDPSLNSSDRVDHSSVTIEWHINSLGERWRRCCILLLQVGVIDDLNDGKALSGRRFQSRNALSSLLGCPDEDFISEIDELKICTSVVQYESLGLFVGHTVPLNDAVVHCANDWE